MLRPLKPVRLEPLPHEKRSPHSEKPRSATKRSPRLSQLEKARAQPQTQGNRKYVFFKIYIFWPWGNTEHLSLA